MEDWWFDSRLHAKVSMGMTKLCSMECEVTLKALGRKKRFCVNEEICIKYFQPSSRVYSMLQYVYNMFLIDCKSKLGKKEMYHNYTTPQEDNIEQNTNVTLQLT